MRRTSKPPFSSLWLGAPGGPGRTVARPLPFSRPVISTESREGGMALVAKIQSPTFFSFLYSTWKDWIGKPPFPRGIQVTYTDVSEAMEIVGLSGASGAGGTQIRRQKKAGGRDVIRTRLRCNWTWPVPHRGLLPIALRSLWLHQLSLGLPGFPSPRRSTQAKTSKSYTFVMSEYGGPGASCSPLHSLWTHRVSNPCQPPVFLFGKLQSIVPHCG